MRVTVEELTRRVDELMQRDIPDHGEEIAQALRDMAKLVCDALAALKAVEGDAEIECIIIIDEYQPGAAGDNTWELVGERVVDALHFSGNQELYVSTSGGLRFRARKIASEASVARATKAQQEAVTKEAPDANDS